MRGTADPHATHEIIKRLRATSTRSRTRDRR
jgi:hypothetical protein